MNKTQVGFGIIYLLITLALIGVLITLYFSRGNEQQQSQFETGQKAIQQAEEINQGTDQAKKLQEQLELQN